jgi:hypothetical protein
MVVGPSKGEARDALDVEAARADVGALLGQADEADIVEGDVFGLEDAYDGGQARV